MNKGFLFVAIFVLTTSCVGKVKEAIKSALNELDTNRISTSRSDYVTDGVDGLFKVDLPTYMKPMTDLNPEASFQCGNVFKEVYFVVIQENKIEYVDAFTQLGEYNNELPLIENYKNVQKAFFSEIITNAEIEEYGLANINNKPARQIKMTGQIEGINAAYIISFIEGEKDVFMLMDWTLKERFDKYENSFEYINGTFNIIN